ncbi:MAG: hypothetical protein LH465_08920 [Sphingomonas bacterium]|nr:hypothetical protein [Sphingomonas bacterium]
MKVLIFGATGMVGLGVLRECLIDPIVSEIVTVGRSASGMSGAKLTEIIRRDLFDIDEVVDGLRGFDACFFCLGVTSVGMSETNYSRLTHDLTLRIATPLAAVNPDMTFIYVSGTATDSSERGSSMWARVKGRTENALLALPFKAAFMFRPGFIQPRHGVTSKTSWYRLLYKLSAPIVGIAERIAPHFITSTDRVGRAMIAIAQHGFDKGLLENADINRAAERRS